MKVFVILLVMVALAASAPQGKNIKDVLLDPSSTQGQIAGALRAEGKAFICNGPLDELMNDLKLPPGPTVGFVFMVKIQECRE
ncbi:hypothetical protein ACHWQZ_G004441 [Mnemiopsis leidyi]